MAAGAPWLETREVSDPSVYLEQLGAGEREAIRLAEETETAVVLLDEKRRRVASHAIADSSCPERWVCSTSPRAGACSIFRPRSTGWSRPRFAHHLACFASSENDTRPDGRSPSSCREGSARGRALPAGEPKSRELEPAPPMAEPSRRGPTSRIVRTPVAHRRLGIAVRRLRPRPARPDVRQPIIARPYGSHDR